MTAAALLGALVLPAAAWTWAPAPEAAVIGTPIELSAKLEAPAGPLALAEGQHTGAVEVLRAGVGGAGTASITVMAFGLGRQALPALRWTAGGTELRSPPL